MGRIEAMTKLIDNVTVTYRDNDNRLLLGAAVGERALGFFCFFFFEGKK